MKKICVLILFCFHLSKGLAQDAGEEIADTTANIDPEEVASPKVGQAELQQFIVQNLNKSIASNPRIKGRVYVKFGIDSLGNIHNPEVIKGLTKEVNQECVRIVRLLSPWNPRKLYGKPVSGEYVLPFTFPLSKTK
jgi:outer membrane biosynthesis protein TonB